MTCYEPATHSLDWAPTRHADPAFSMAIADLEQVHLETHPHEDPRWGCRSCAVLCVALQHTMRAAAKHLCPCSPPVTCACSLVLSSEKGMWEYLQPDWCVFDLMHSCGDPFPDFQVRAASVTTLCGHVQPRLSCGETCMPICMRILVGAFICMGILVWGVYWPLPGSSCRYNTFWMCMCVCLCLCVCVCVCVCVCE